MNSGRLVFLLALCFKSVSSNDQTGCLNSEGCVTQQLMVSPDSSVLLPCYLKASNSTKVSWTQTSTEELVFLTHDGHVQFSDPRRGRVKTFPNHGLEGNFSIRIDELKDSDLGCYFCKWEQDCFQVNLVAEQGPQSTNVTLLIYSCVGVAGFILLCVGGYFYVKRSRSCDKTPRDDVVISSECEGVRAPPAGGGGGGGGGGRGGRGGRVHFQQQRGVYINDLVYENDDYDPANQQGAPQDAAGTQPSGNHPNSTQFKFVRMENQSTKRRFHTELFNRLRQASFSRHYYVNRGEINNQEATVAAHFKKGVGHGRAKDNCEYKNPIYNRSTEHLDQM